MALKTSLLIAGDATGAVAAAGQAADALGKVDAANRTTAVSSTALGAATDRVAVSEEKAAISGTTLAAVEREVAAESTRAKKAHNDDADAGNRVAEAHGKMGASGAILQHVVRSSTDSFVAGLPITMILGEQIGRLGEAAALSGGALGSFGAFMGGPWGLLLSAGLGVLGSLAGRLIDTGDGADKLAEKLMKLEDALGKQAFATEAAKKALDDYNAAQDAARKGDSLTVGIALQLADARLKEALATREASKAALARALADRSANNQPGIGGVAGTAGYIQGQGDVAVGRLKGQIAAEDGSIAGIAQAQRNLYIQRAGTVAAEAVDPVKRLNDQYDRLRDGAIRAAAGNDTLAKSLDATETAIERRRKAAVDAEKDAEKKDRKHGPTAATLANRAYQLDRYGDQTGDTIARIASQFDGTPPVVRQVNDQVARLDEIMKDLSQRKPPGFAGLIADAKAAKVAVQDGLNKPFDDYVKGQEHAFQIAQLTAAGLTDQAQAQQAIYGIEQQRGTLDEAHRAAVVGTVEALRAEQQQIDVNRAHLQPFLTALGSIRGIVDDATQAWVCGDLGQLVKEPGKLLDAFQTLKGQQLFDKMFDGVFRDLQDQLNGVSPVKDAADRMAKAVDLVTVSARATATALDSVARAASDGAGAPKPAYFGADGIPIDGAGHAINGIASGGSLANPASAEVAVVGNRLHDPTALFQKALGGVAAQIGSIFTNPEHAREIGRNVGIYAGKGLEGAATGSIVAGLGKSIGVDLSKGGAQLGGAIGGILGSIKGVTSALGPFGAAVTPVLSIVGGLVTKLFHSTTTSSAAIGAVNGQFAGTASTGSNAQLASQANSLAGVVAGSLQQIADQLGGGVAATSRITIGTKNGKYHVNAVGGKIGVKGSGDIGFGQDEGAAEAYALQQEIAQGAISGLSTAVQRALQSSTDLNAGLKEALKVQQVEQLVGGLGSTIAKQFSDYEAQAKDRLRIATQYGFDVVAIEKKNAEDRAKIADALLKQQVGSLQSLVEEMTSGSLFEGSAIDKLQALAGSIEKAKADLDAGVDGAGDKLATLEQQRLAAAKDAYGTTGGYATARDATLDEARAAIAKANAQITAAQAKSDPALATTNAALDENNDQNAELISRMKEANALLTRIATAQAAAAQSPGYDLYDLYEVGYVGSNRK
ncbi:hypothetical protein [Sphingomonas bacterium]|uniref:hypothetical protein n=1 Tax=Sphingomonas bacterium TaxID=1895847 RepID=UPI0015775039|nr:hypothetical protein [Sphingomonas bacterium]